MVWMVPLTAQQHASQTHFIVLSHSNALPAGRWQVLSALRHQIRLIEGNFTGFWHSLAIRVARLRHHDVVAHGIVMEYSVGVHKVLVERRGVPDTHRDDDGD
ncbi:hypothetical protein TcCL_NonESM02772 [Trypanosoma cruzi]|nr:hypothetical protein TcCL_NonESM02772 [Trypanosoma cruzi]